MCDATVPPYQEVQQLENHVPVRGHSFNGWYKLNESRLTYSNMHIMKILKSIKI